MPVYDAVFNDKAENVSEEKFDVKRITGKPWFWRAVLILAVFCFFLPLLRANVVFIRNQDVYLHLFFRTVAHDALAQGELPLWNHHINGGFPVYAHPEFPFPNLLAGLWLLLGPLAGMKMELLLWFLLAANALYSLLRRHYRLTGGAAALVSCLVVCSFWTVQRFIIDGDINDTAVFLFIVFLNVYTRVLDPVIAEQSGRTFSWRGLARAAAGRPVLPHVLFLILLTGIAMASGKGHLAVYGLFAALVGAYDTVALALTQRRWALLPPLFLLLALGLPLLLFQARIQASLDLSSITAGGFDFANYRNADNTILAEIVRRQLSEMYCGGWLAWALFAAGAVYGLVKRQNLRILLVLAAATVLIFGPTTRAGEIVFSLPVMRRLINMYKYFGFYLHLSLWLLTVPLIMRGLVRQRALVIAVLVLVSLAEFPTVRGEVERRLTEAVLPVEAEKRFVQVTCEKNLGLAYYFYKANIGIIDWRNPLQIETPVIPYGTLPENKCTTLGLPRTKINPDYRGEAWFAADQRRTGRIRRGCNRLTVIADVSQADKTLVINTNYHRAWIADIGEVVDHNGLLALTGLPPGKQTVNLRFAPRAHIIRQIVDLLLMLLLAVAALALAVTNILRKKT